jgi:hypothetical protein
MSNGANNHIFKNNIVYDSGSYHIYSEHSSNGTLNVFDYNVYYPDGALFMDRSAVRNNFAAWQAGLSQDSHSFSADPLFTSPLDFHLQSTSPAINAGIDVGLTSDFEGKPIVGTPDIGAYEYQGGGGGDITAPAAPSGLSVN